MDQKRGCKTSPKISTMSAEYYHQVMSLVLHFTVSARDVLVWSMISKGWKQWVEDEKMLRTWLTAQRQGAVPPSSERCVGAQPWLMQVRRRALLERLLSRRSRSGPSVAKKWQSSSRGYSDSMCTELHHIRGMVVVGKCDGSIELWNPYRSYQWNSGKDHCVGNFYDCRRNECMKGRVTQLSTVGEDKLLGVSEGANIMVWDLNLESTTTKA